MRTTKKGQRPGSSFSLFKAKSKGYSPDILSYIAKQLDEVYPERSLAHIEEVDENEENKRLIFSLIRQLRSIAKHSRRRPLKKISTALISAACLR